jgi:hypothetical protein
MTGWWRLSEDGQLVSVDDTTSEQTCPSQSVPLFVQDEIPVIIFSTVCKLVNAVSEMIIKCRDAGLLSPLAGVFRWPRGGGRLEWDG